ncbi:FkbM family methyltransferase [Chelativorans salis]|uniref:FkbM family methyltransferase n=1 Tax=Chelativorans salis TaxID=2978478 RepID=A0ABT2LNA1_9HYPH|nr:FkbM family methyltransferase [Chelativorans sp. EGI FJ00035]MCT7374659.1 FkbM family methyltransferase [Chelativorans sp. EGI FJ00035]
MTLTVHGVKVPLDPTELSPEIWQALSNGTYEAKEARWVFKSVRPHDRVLELGSGIGILTALIAGIEGVHVWSFEANPSSVRLARRVIEANNLENVTLTQGILAAGPPRDFIFYARKDLWMSSIVEHQGPYDEILTIPSVNIDQFISQHEIDVIVMDIEGAERDLLIEAELPGVERIFLELHDHLYGLAGIRDITQALASKGFGYDPRGSSGPCVLFSRGNEPRLYQSEGPDF